MPSLGVEIEMPVAGRADGRTHKVGPFFQKLREIRRARGEDASLSIIGGAPMAVHSGLVVSTLDNAFNNLESTVGPIPEARGNLVALERTVRRELEDVAGVLALEQAMVCNFSEHPDVEITPEFYRFICAPKPLYGYLIGHRGFAHQVGVDAKAHNGPTTGVEFGRAVEALNVVLGTAGAFVALYANSPFEGGRFTGRKENRQTIWRTMFADCRFPCDRKFHGPVERPFADLRDYFQWMYGPGTNMWFLPSTGDYKLPGSYALVQGDPPLLDFMRAASWPVRCADPGGEISVRPAMDHFAFHQFTNYLDGRIRYGLGEEPFAVEEFLAALDGSGRELEELFERKAGYCYIEGRAAGANFPDRELAEEAGGEVAASVIISPSALQAGLLRNLDQASRLVGDCSWSDLMGLKEAAIRDALDGESGRLTARGFCARVLEVAADGLEPEEQWMLAYPRWVLSTGRTGADRALEFCARDHGPDHDRLRRLVMAREMVLP